MHGFSKRDQEEGKKLVAEGRIVSVFYSEGTYQIEVAPERRGGETLWPFLQVDDDGEIHDSFCTCDAAEKKGSCSHLAAAYSRIMAVDPLHVRFRESLWHWMGHALCNQLGYEESVLKKREKGYYVEGEYPFAIQTSNKETGKRLEKILVDRPVETEETSLKFSNLPSEELALWREGRPSPSLRYELSFWSDLSKWWMELQETGVKYTITFSEELPPKTLSVSFPGLSIVFTIAQELWSELIPVLQTVDSPLEVHPFPLGRLEEIHFHAQEGKLSLEYAEGNQKNPQPIDLQQGVEVGEWLYVPRHGFYPKHSDPLLMKTEITNDEVGQFLRSYSKLAHKYLKGVEIHFHPVPLQYEIALDGSYSMHIDSYVYSKKDLTESGAHYFGDWAYLPEHGFFPIEEQMFESASFVISKEKLSEFINKHRVWLHGYEGFQPHVSGIESHLGFKLNEEGNLTFYTRLEFTEEKEHVVDVGDWIYVEGKGFYSKITTRPGMHVKANLVVEQSQISAFIHQHADELETIPGFFSTECPLEKTGLNIGFNADNRIEIHPEYFFAKQHKGVDVAIYGDYTYIEGEGFSLIPHDARLPEAYKEQQVIDPLAEPYFVSYELELLYPHVMTIDHKLKRPESISFRLNSLKRDTSVKSGQWVLDLMCETQLGSVPLHTLWQGLMDERPYLFTEAGLIFLRGRRFDWLASKTKKSWLRKGVALRLNTLEFFRLCALEEVLQPEGDDRISKNTRHLLEVFLNLEPTTEIDLTGLKSDLRSYQHAGVKWLWFLYSFGISGLLCDEMGLGKTHQAMALIAGVRNTIVDRKARFLVVCPTSVIYHWEKLIHNFLPSVKPYIFHGIDRDFSHFLEGQYDLLLTSYGIVRTENAALSKVHFDVAVIDELQVAKNEKSMTNRSLRKLDAGMRLGLTGTPIENRLLELKALFDLILPTYLPSSALFRELFVHPIEKGDDEKKKHLLSRLIRPFLLRRKKSEVLTELPEKIEEIALCDLSDEQRTLYSEVVNENRDTLLEELSDRSRPPPIAHIFSMLSKLKQICDHPSLLIKDVKNYTKHASGKWDLFCELVSEVRDSGQKLVIFSQYLDMLDIMRLYCKEQSIKYAEIRGSTKDRKEQVELFANDPTCEIFLGSLQAAGVGIDLTEASVVIHYDRWWNPAKENQATDRVHRMGQKRGVQVFKFITKGTIEEQIHLMIEKKLHLAKGVIGFDEQDQLKGLDRDELIQLLQLLELS